MPEQPPSSPRLPADYVYAWFALHPRAFFGFVAALFLFSAWLILRLWVVHRDTSLHEKIIWSFLLLFPVLGWVFYVGFFRVPGYNDTPLLDEYTSINQ